MFFKYQNSKPVRMFPGVTRRTLISGEKMMLTEFTYEKGAFVPTHRHPHEQISCVIEGKYKIYIEGKEYIVEKGDSYLIPSNIEHSQQTIEETITVDVFSPPRKEYKQTPQKEDEG